MCVNSWTFTLPCVVSISMCPAVWHGQPQSPAQYSSRIVQYPGLLASIRSFLEGRTAYVKCNGATSHTFHVGAGIPQGSTLGPILFSAFINSVNSLSLSDGAKIISYADDIVYIRGFKSDNCVQGIQSDLDLIASHITNIKLLSINNNKTKY